MEHISAAPRERRSVSPGLAAALLWIAAFAYVAVGFVTAVSRVRAAGGDLEQPVSLVGLPLLVAFKHAGRIGTHVEWGLAVLLVAPFVIGMLLALVRVRRATT